jgi:hypothetical protein
MFHQWQSEGRGVESVSNGVAMGKLIKKAKLVPASEMVQVDYTTTTRAAPALAWKIFADWRQWSKFSDLYGELRWTQGNPWAVGSRLRMELLHPVKFIVNRLITMCRPGECVTWIDHSRGTTVEQWVTFKTEPDGLTYVRILSQGIASRPKVAGQPFRAFLKDNSKLWFDAFCKECDRVQAAG